MKWVAISGSWRKHNEHVERDVRETIRRIMSAGDGIVTGGALGVDYFATDEALKLEPQAQRIKIFLPATLERLAAHLRRRADEAGAQEKKEPTHQQVEQLIEQLTTVQQANSDVLHGDQNNTVVNKDAYSQRNGKVIELANALVAFQVNESAGVQDTINQAKEKGIPIQVFSYQIL